MVLLAVVPLLVWTNIYYSWVYESRNVVPVLPLLATIAVPVARRRREEPLQPDRWRKAAPAPAAISR